MQDLDIEFLDFLLGKQLNNNTVEEIKAQHLKDVEAVKRQKELLQLERQKKDFMFSSNRVEKAFALEHAISYYKTNYPTAIDAIKGLEDQLAELTTSDKA